MADNPNKDTSAKIVVPGTSHSSNRPVKVDHWENLKDDLSGCLVFKENVEECGVYGIGLKIDTARIPYIVKEGSKIFDENGKSINDLVNVGDTISSIDGYPMEKVIEQCFSDRVN